MLYIFMVLIGIVAGMKAFPKTWERVNNIVQGVIIIMLLFTMGVGIASQPGFLRDIKTAGWDSLIYAFAAMAGSVGVICLLNRIWGSREK